MLDNLHRKRRKLPLKLLTFFTGIILVLVGYGLLSLAPENNLAKTTDRVFLGMGVLVAGAVLWVGSLFFKK
jgi:CHASE3 domain sensor protein